MSFAGSPANAVSEKGVGTLHPEAPSGYQAALTIVTSIALFGSAMTVVIFFILLALNPRRVNIPLVKLTLAIQSVNSVALITTLVLNEVEIRAPILCGSLRYILYICYLASIFMCCAITIHFWLVITRRKLSQAKRNERWYYIIPITLAITLSAALAVIPDSAYHMPGRCALVLIPSSNYLGIRWGFYYAWFIIASAISFYCMASVLFSTRRLTHTTDIDRDTYTSSTEAYRNAVNARANGKRLRSLAFYTITYPLISFVCNFPMLLQELLSTVLKRRLAWFVLASRLILYSEGLLLSLAFFLYPAVRHSIRDLVNSAVQYWVIDQEEFWRLRRNQLTRRNSSQAFREKYKSSRTEEQIVRDFSSRRGRLYHFIFSKTPEGRVASTL
ncbi:hypothetical protein COEREDRAFT_6783 [Coemansia reversa NRRL 1564]|uniref:G-protein coupled receptors family 1 profile domain-containing protein n=1 Tax=Coemansia reversa (strain ATCC 12441 / NRRL 1564) TaxID=763665 RepID=A0A2G5BGB2_COERN|nr:hypothetical protein COEREDRAFT_6783 [Coemansia reversa NRRL 1564]|eukprot:PIA18041.1 hypothetical protein COEREDRAFT_6783 [Coemansia reversa NRRL 1564]